MQAHMCVHLSIHMLVYVHVEKLAIGYSVILTIHFSSTNNLVCSVTLYGIYSIVEPFDLPMQNTIIAYCC